MKDNKLIADFMGVQYKSDEEYLKKLKEMREHGIGYEQGYMESQLNYHESWDWLMPVVEMINLLDDYRYTFLIASMDTQIVDNITNDVIVEVSCKHSVDELIKSVYEAVVKFIKQLNK